MILFLDSDNWYTPQHAAEALSLKSLDPDIDIAVLGRNIVLPNGTPVEGDPEDINRSHIDTSCYCFFETSFGVLPTWGMMQPFLGPICDRIMFYAIQQRRYKIAWSDRKTCYFTSNYRNHYLLAGLAPPASTNDSDIESIAKLFKENHATFKARTGLTFNIQFNRRETHTE